MSHICGHFIKDAVKITDREPFGITGNVCRGSPQYSSFVDVVLTEVSLKIYACTSTLKNENQMVSEL